MDADKIAAILKIKEDLLAELSLGKNENTFSFLPQSKRSIRTYKGTNTTSLVVFASYSKTFAVKTPAF